MSFDLNPMDDQPIDREEYERWQKRNAGLYEKFTVKRNDGRDAPGEKHDGCRYFVLDVDHDPHAIPALEAYLKSCGSEYPELAEDLRLLVMSKKLSS